MNTTIVEDIQKFEKECQGYVDGFKTLSPFANQNYIIKEGRGLNMSFNKILKQLSKDFINVGGQQAEHISGSQCILWELIDYNVDTSFFMYKPSFEIYGFKSPKNQHLRSFFDDSEVELTKDNHLAGCLFVQEQLTNHDGVNLNFISEYFWHEFHHAYTLYMILMKNNGVLPNNVLKTNANYERNINRVQYSKEFENDINRIIYTMNRGEIDANMSQIFPFIQKNKKINFDNYKEYINKIPGYNVIQGLQSAVKFLETIQYDDYWITSLNQILNRIYKTNLTSNESYKRFNNRLIKDSLYATRQFYKVLSYSLQKCKRRSQLRGMKPIFSEGKIYTKQELIEKLKTYDKTI